MNKKEFVQELAKRSGLSQKKALEVVDIIFSSKDGDGIIAVQLDQNGKVVMPGFGTFSTRSRAARTGVHPGSGDKIEIPARKAVHFKPATNLRERVEE